MMVKLTLRPLSSLLGRLPQSLESEPADCRTPSQLCPSPATSESTVSSVPSESPDTFSSLHSSLAPPNLSQSLSGSPPGSIDNLSSEGSSPTMADKKKRAPLPPSHPAHGTQSGGNQIHNPAYVDGPQQGKKLSLPLPDYETLFPQKRHGVKGQTRWDHIIAEVNQRQRDIPSDFLGPEMSVDSPEEHEPSVGFSLPQKRSALMPNQTQPQETKPVSTKKVAAPAPPEPVTPPQPRPAAESSLRQSQNIPQQSLMRPTPSAAPGPVNTDASSREITSARSREGARRVLQPSPAARAASPLNKDISTPNDQRNAQVTMNKEAPTAKPRQRVSGKEPDQQEDAVVTPVVSDKNMNSNIQMLSSSSVSSMDKKGRQVETFAAFDPFPSTDLLAKDPWAQMKQNQEVDDHFKHNVRKEQKLEDRGMTTHDLDSIFNQDRLTDPFAGFNGSDSAKHSEHREKDNLKVDSPAFQRRNSQRRNQTPPSTTHPDYKISKSPQEPAFKEESTRTSANQGLNAQHIINEAFTPKLQADVKTQSHVYGGEDPFGAEPFTLNHTEPHQVVMEEPEPLAEGLSGGKMPLRAWVAPSETQPVNAQNNNGGGLSFIPRRPHPVKPMSTVESKSPFGTPAVKEIKVRDSTPGKIQANTVESGPYTQLTQEELITLVVKQQTDLSRKDAKITELEEYIDNLLVRVIDEKPSILQSLNAKPV
ncbi:uncharacterized protein rab11fip1a isoform 2-T2 [Acanthopagrus schlegelii]